MRSKSHTTSNSTCHHHHHIIIFSSIYFLSSSSSGEKELQSLSFPFFFFLFLLFVALLSAPVPKLQQLSPAGSPLLTTNFLHAHCSPANRTGTENQHANIKVNRRERHRDGEKSKQHSRGKHYRLQQIRNEVYIF